MRGIRRALTTLALLTGILATTALPALAGSPHFVDDTVAATVDGATLTVTGKEAGLGNEEQIHVAATATASCINPGGNKPRAANKVSVQAQGDFPVMNGKATFELGLVASFQPECSPPMSVAWSEVTVTDTTNGITVTL